MSQVNQLLKDLSRHSDAVKKCCKPLNHLGITCFYYVHIKNNGDYILLTDCPHIDDYYFDEKLYVEDPYIRHPSNYQSGFFLFEQNQKHQFDQSLAYLVQNFKMTPLIGFCERNTDSVEHYGFWGRSDRKNSFMDVYLKYSTLLKAFTDHFKKECREVLRSDSVPYLSLTDLIGTDFITSAIKNNKGNQDLINKYLNEIGLGNEVKKASLLTPREKECIMHILKGKSAKESAQVLDLSHRTVEHYLENVKNKFGCQFKNELFSSAERLNELGLL